MKIFSFAAGMALIASASAVSIKKGGEEVAPDAEEHDGPDSIDTILARVASGDDWESDSFNADDFSDDGGWDSDGSSDGGNHGNDDSNQRDEEAEEAARRQAAIEAARAAFPHCTALKYGQIRNAKSHECLTYVAGDWQLRTQACTEDNWRQLYAYCDNGYIAQKDNACVTRQCCAGRAFYLAYCQRHSYQYFDLLDSHACQGSSGETEEASRFAIRDHNGYGMEVQGSSGSGRVDLWYWEGEMHQEWYWHEAEKYVSS